jgi:plastocyanin
MSRKYFSHFGQLFTFLAVMLLSAFRASADTIEVKVENFNFKPAQITIKPGDTVHWRWSGSFHSTTSGANRTEIKSGIQV